jgi:acyl carrier protein
MPDLTSKLVAILKQYACDQADRITGCTKLSDLEIDLLDLPMIILDIEDLFDIHVRYDDRVEGIATLDDLVACVASHIEVKASPCPRLPRAKRAWMSTGAEHRPESSRR